MLAHSVIPARRRPVAAALALAALLPLATSKAALGADACSGRQPSVPLAIDGRVFDGSAKGLVGADGIILSTKLSNSAWTSFFFPASGTTVRAFANDPTTIPSLDGGDTIVLARSNYTADYQAVAGQWPPGSMVVLAVVTSLGDVGTVSGFATVRVQAIQTSGNPRYIQGTLVSVDVCSPGAAAGQPTTF